MNWVTKGYNAYDAHQHAVCAGADRFHSKRQRLQARGHQSAKAIPNRISMQVSAGLLALSQTEGFRLVADCEYNSAEDVGLWAQCQVESVIVGAVDPFILGDNHDEELCNWFNDMCQHDDLGESIALSTMARDLGTELCRMYRDGELE